MASDTTCHPEPNMEESKYDEPQTQGTVYVKWDVKGGRDRTHNPYIDTDYQLEGSPNIQGVEIKSTVPVTLSCWSGSRPSGTPALQVQGPTNGKHKVNPVRYGSYRVEKR